MTAPALRGRHSTEPRQPERATKADECMGQPCPHHPDVHAAAAAVGMTRPRALDALQRLYDRLVANADADFDFGSAVLTYMTRHGSRPVDLAVGERVAWRLTR